MPRHDLLALTDDDLVAATNRGTVKRARRELGAGKHTVELDEDADGTITARWSNGVECVLPGDGTIHEARCTSVPTGLSRHVIRTVLAYQALHADSGVRPSVEPWDPGAFSDDDLATQFTAAQLRKARRAFDEGVLVELNRSAKPTSSR